jgi:nicotinate-nucleotide adenylyltransferase
MTERIGVFGGTFNPIHLGHLHIAGEIQKIFSLSQVHFVVATTPPHKGSGTLIHFTHRYAMATLATSGIASFIPSMIELEPEASSYSVDTMAKLTGRFGPEDTALYFIAGGDSLYEVKSWRQSEKLLTSYNFIFALRPGTGPFSPQGVLPEKSVPLLRDLTGMERDAARRIIREKDPANRIYVLDVGAPEISATRIRKLISSGKPVHRMVPRPVCDYIRKLHLYMVEDD